MRGEMIARISMAKFIRLYIILIFGPYTHMHVYMP